MNKLFVITITSLLMHTISYGMFKKLNIPFFLKHLHTKTCSSKKPSMENEINTALDNKPQYQSTEPQSKNLQLFASLISNDIQNIEKQMDRLQKSVTTIQNLEDIIKKYEEDNNDI